MTLTIEDTPTPLSTSYRHNTVVIHGETGGVGVRHTTGSGLVTQASETTGALFQPVTRLTLYKSLSWHETGTFPKSGT